MRRWGGAGSIRGHGEGRPLAGGPPVTIHATSVVVENLRFVTHLDVRLPLARHGEGSFHTQGCRGRGRERHKSGLCVALQLPRLPCGNAMLGATHTAELTDATDARLLGAHPLCLALGNQHAAVLQGGRRMWERKQWREKTSVPGAAPHFVCCAHLPSRVLPLRLDPGGRGRAAPALSPFQTPSSPATPGPAPPPHASGQHRRRRRVSTSPATRATPPHPSPPC